CGYSVPEVHAAPPDQDGEEDREPASNSYTVDYNRNFRQGHPALSTSPVAWGRLLYLYFDAAMDFLRVPNHVKVLGAVNEKPRAPLQRYPRLPYFSCRERLSPQTNQAVIIT